MNPIDTSKLSMIEKVAYKFLLRLRTLSIRDSEILHLLTDEEIKKIRHEVWYTLGWAAFFGVVGVLALYLPQYFFEEYFYEYPLYIPLLETTWKVPVVSMIYGIFLVYIEIYALMALNIRAVFKIAEVCGFPDKNDPDFHYHIESLMRVGLERHDKTSITYGINPLQGASRWTLIVFLVISRLKATISNYIAKFILRRLLGRYALRAIIDMVGVPVFAFWNAYASWIVIHETKVRIMAPNLIRSFSANLYHRFSHDEIFKQHIYDVLQYIAMSKRRYHHNHFLLAKSILQSFSIPVKEVHELTEEFPALLKRLPPDTKEGLLQFLLLGFIIDGNLSPKEKILLGRLHESGVIPYDAEHVKKFIHSFIEGKGLDELVNLQKNK